MVFQYIGATIGALATGEWNIFLMMERYGLLEFAFFALFLGSWSTCMAAIYFAANLLSAPPMPLYKDEERTRKLVLIICWSLALFFSLYGPDQIFNFFLLFLAWLIGPIAITVIIDYWLFPSRRYLYEKQRMQSDSNINPAAFFAWIIGFLTGYFTQDIFISLLNGMIATGLVYYSWMYYAIKNKTTPENQIRKFLGKEAIKIEQD
jgi:cytosine permease